MLLSIIIRVAVYELALSMIFLERKGEILLLLLALLVATDAILS